MIEAREIVYRVGSRAILGGVTATFAPGQVHLIVGPNGAGKSTLVRVLARLLRPTAGRVAYGGADIARVSEHDLSTRRAVLSQAVEIAFPLSVREVVMMGRYPHFGGRPTAIDETVCEDVMRYFDIADLGARSYTTLSGGERQRVNFARVLAQVWRPISSGARYLFLDEPLTFLDIGHQLDFMRKVEAFVAGGDVVVVGVIHDLGLAARFGDRLLMMYDGRLVADGAPREVLTSTHIRAVFGVEPMFLADPAGSAEHLVFL